MSYPPAIYRGDGGEVSATIRRHDCAPDLVYPAGTRVHYLSTGDTTGGLFGLYRWEMTGSPGGPDAHFHRTITESFYILDGEVTIFDGTSWVVTRSGDYVHVPAGGLHGFRNDSGAPASMLIHFAPGAPREAYFEALAAGAGAQAMTQAERAAFMAAHDTSWA